MAAPTAAPGSIRKRPTSAIPARTTAAEIWIFLSADRRDRAPGSSLAPSLATGLPLLLFDLFQVLFRLDGGPVQAPHSRRETDPEPDARQPGAGSAPPAQVVPPHPASAA